MSSISDQALRQLEALNKWLSAVYDEETSFNTLLLDTGFSEAEIEQIRREYLSEFLYAVVDLMSGYTAAPGEQRNNRLMVQHYGLLDGEPLDFYTISPSVGVSGNRIRQLVNKGLDLYRRPERQAKFRSDFAAIGRRLLTKAFPDKK